MESSGRIVRPAELVILLALACKYANGSLRQHWSGLSCNSGIISRVKLSEVHQDDRPKCANSALSNHFSMKERVTRLVACVVCMVSIFSCGGPRKDVLKIELENGSLSTPEKEYRLRLLSEAKLKMLTNIEAGQAISSLYVHGHDRRYEFAVFATPSESYQSRFYVGFPGDIESPNPVEIQEASYFFNNGDRRQLLLDSGRNRLVVPGIISRSYRLTLPSELLAHQIREDGDGLQDPQRYKARLESERYRFLIEMLVNKEPYTLDISFRYRIGTAPKTGVPGMP